MNTFKTVLIIFVILILIVAAAYMEYRVIMVNIKPYHGENNTVYLEVFGFMDEYESIHISEIER